MRRFVCYTSWCRPGRRCCLCRVKSFAAAAPVLGILIGPASGATSICRPTFNGFLEFECQERQGKVNAAPFCDVMNRQGGAFHWSRRDTGETKNRADLINAAGKRLCGWR